MNYQDFEVSEFKGAIFLIFASPKLNLDAQIRKEKGKLISYFSYDQPNTATGTSLRLTKAEAQKVSAFFSAMQSLTDHEEFEKILKMLEEENGK